MQERRTENMKESQRCVVVTGASSGIGLGTVRVLCQAGYHVCGSVRRPADGERLAAEFGDAFTPLLFDITDQAAVKEAAKKVRAPPDLALVINAHAQTGEGTLLSAKGRREDVC